MRTKWKPVDIECRANDRVLPVRTKLVRGPDSAAMCVAEAISHAVMTQLGLILPECIAVHTSREFTDDLTRQYAFDPPVVTGRHFGTTFLGASVQETEWHQALLRIITQPRGSVRVFLGDVIVANPDRRTHGNALIGTLSGNGPIRLIPIDHSEAFNRHECIRDGAALRQVVGDRIAYWLEGTEAVVLDMGDDFVNSEIDRAMAREDPICVAVQSVPGESLDQAEIDPDQVTQFLSDRVRNLRQLADVSYWNQLRGLGGGGYVIGS